MCLIKNIVYLQHGLSAKTIATLQRNDLTAVPFRNRIMGSLYVVERLEILHKLDGHDGCVNSINFNQKGDYLVSGSDDLHLIVWKWASKKQKHKFHTGHRQNVFQTKFVENGLNANGFNIVTSARDGDVRYVEIQPDGGVSARFLYSHARKSVNKVAMSSLSPFEFLSAGEDGCVKQYDLRTGKCDDLLTLRTRQGRKVPLYSIALNPYDTEFCVCGRDKYVRVHDKRNPKQALMHLFPNTLAEVCNLIYT